MNRFFLIVAIFCSVVEGLHISRQREKVAVSTTPGPIGFLLATPTSPQSCPVDMRFDCHQDLPAPWCDPYGNCHEGCKPSRGDPPECSAPADTGGVTPTSTIHISNNKCCNTVWSTPDDTDLWKNESDPVLWQMFPDADRTCSGMPIRTLELDDYCTLAGDGSTVATDVHGAPCLQTVVNEIANGGWGIKKNRQLWPSVCYRIKRQQPLHQFGSFKSMMCSSSTTMTGEAQMAEDSFKCRFYEYDGCAGTLVITKSYTRTSWNKNWNYYNHSEGNELRNAWTMYLNGGGHHPCFYSYGDPLSMGYDPQMGESKLGETALTGGGPDWGRTRETTNFLLPFDTKIFPSNMLLINHPFYALSATDASAADAVGWTPSPSPWRSMYGRAFLETSGQKEMSGEDAWEEFEEMFEEDAGEKSEEFDLEESHDSDIFEEMSHWEEPEEFDLEELIGAPI